METRVVLTKSMLTLVLLAPRLTQAPLRGASEGEFVIFEDGGHASQAHLTVLVNDNGDGTWQLIVRTNPPVVGRLRLTSGKTRLCTSFLSDGSATMSAIPFALLTEPNTPDLELIVLPVRGSTRR